MTKKEKWQSFFMDPTTWRFFQNCCVIVFGGISWVYGTKALKQLSLQLYDYLTKYHFHDGGTLLSIAQRMNTLAYNFIYYPLLILTVISICLDCFVIKKQNRIKIPQRALVSFHSMIGLLGFFGGMLPDFVINGQKGVSHIAWTWLIITLVSYFGFSLVRSLTEVPGENLILIGKDMGREVIKSVIKIVPITDETQISFTLKPSNSFIEGLQKDIVELIVKANLNKNITDEAEIVEQAMDIWQSIPDISVKAFLELMLASKETAPQSLLFMNEEDVIRALILLQNQIREEQYVVRP